jgi:hypothetical protein
MTNRYFTLEEAEAILPDVSGTMKSVQDLKRRIDEKVVGWQKELPDAPAEQAIAKGQVDFLRDQSKAPESRPDGGSAERFGRGTGRLSGPHRRERRVPLLESGGRPHPVLARHHGRFFRPQTSQGRDPQPLSPFPGPIL